MLQKILSLVILTAILSGCKTTNSNVTKISLPEFPIAGKAVAQELSTRNCSKEQCPNLNNWLNEIYLFKLKYEIYRQGLK